MIKLDAFTRSYIVTMLWSTTDESTPEGGEPMDANYSGADVAPIALVQIVADCEAFQKECSDHYDDSEQAGHDFWLTRNGHGAGFWDGDYPEPEASILTAASKRFGELYPYVGDDGLIYTGGE